jgi:hypothetical protein
MAIEQILTMGHLERWLILVADFCFALAMPITNVDFLSNGRL